MNKKCILCVKLLLFFSVQNVFAETPDSAERVMGEPPALKNDSLPPAATASEPEGHDADQKSEAATNDMRSLPMLPPPPLPDFANLAANMIEKKLAVLSQPENAALLAKFIKNFHDSLLAEGFSSEEALQIITAVGVPGDR